MDFNNEKGTKIIGIVDYKYPNLHGYYILDDRWINENDTLIDRKDNVYKILDYQLLEKYKMFAESPIDKQHIWNLKTYAAVKLDKQIEIGTILYVKPKIFNFFI